MMVCATSKASDQPAHTRSRIRAIASRLNFLFYFIFYLFIQYFQRVALLASIASLPSASDCQATDPSLLEITCCGSNVQISQFV